MAGRTPHLEYKYKVMDFATTAFDMAFFDGKAFAQRRQVIRDGESQCDYICETERIVNEHAFRVRRNSYSAMRPNKFRKMTKENHRRIETDDNFKLQLTTRSSIGGSETREWSHHIQSPVRWPPATLYHSSLAQLAAQMQMQLRQMQNALGDLIHQRSLHLRCLQLTSVCQCS